MAYRLALWHPRLVTHLFSICTPYFKPAKRYVPLEEYLKQGKATNFGYQLKLRDGQIDGITSKHQIKQVLNAAYSGEGQDVTRGFSIQHGFDIENLSNLKPTKLVSDALLDYYADQYSRNGLRGTSELNSRNWPKTALKFLTSSDVVSDEGAKLSR